jgi:hypothetical protein
VRDRTAAYRKYQDRLSQQLKNFVHVYVLVRQNLRSSIKSPPCTIFFSQGPSTLTLTRAHLCLSKPFSQSRSTCIYSNSSNPLFVRPPTRRRSANGTIRTHTPSIPRPRRLWRWRRRPRIRKMRRRVLLVLGSKEPRLTPEA